MLTGNLRDRLNHAYAAAVLGVTWEPGNPAGTSGLSVDEALREAAEFIKALYDQVIAAEVAVDHPTEVTP